MRGRLSVTAAGAAAALALTVVAGCGQTVASGGSSPGASGEPGAHTYHPPVSAVPALSGTLLTGGHWSLASWRGRPVVVNFWQSTCTPCMAESAVLDAAATRDAAAGVRFMGVDVTDTNSAGRAFLRREHVPYSALEDPDGVLLGRFGRFIDGVATPDTLVFNANGQLSASVIGSVSAAELAGLIRTAQS